MSLSAPVQESVSGFRPFGTRIGFRIGSGGKISGAYPLFKDFYPYSDSTS